MKKNQYKLVSFLLIINYLCIAQNVGINSTGANPHPSALLDVDASPNNNTGILIPRIALTSVAIAAPVSNPATSLLVYNTASANTGTNAVKPGYYYWDGIKWVGFANGTSWDVLGNTGTNPSTNFLGTTDAQDLVFRTNNLEKARVTAAGNVGIGTATPSEKLEVNGNVHAQSGPLNYATLTADGGVELYRDPTVAISFPTSGYVDFKSTATDDYRTRLYHNNTFGPSGSFAISSTTNGLTSSAVDHFVVANNTGYVGIGTTAPTLKLHLHDASQNFHAIRLTAGVSQANFWDIIKRGDNYAPNQNNNFALGYNNIEKFTITPTGEVGIGSAIPLSRLDVFGPKPTATAGTGGLSNGASQAIIPAGVDGYSYRNDWPSGWGGGVATWDINGNTAYFTAYATRSDERLKKDISTMNKSVTTNFMKLRPVTYLLKEETPETMGTQYGFIAQEVAKLFPSIVTKDSGLEGAKIGMNYQALIAPTIYVVQEQQKKIDLQQLQIQELLKRIEVLEKK